MTATTWVPPEAEAGPAAADQRDDLAGLLDEVGAYLCRYVHFPIPEQADAIALWVAYTHALPALGQPLFDVVPYLSVTSAEKQSGKSTLGTLLGILSARPLGADGISPAALLRLLDGRPTMLLDEVDAIFPEGGRGPGELQDLLRGILNSGYRVGGVYYKADPTKPKGQQAVAYPTFGPKALFGIGRGFPPTVTDRSVPIRMERAPKGGQRARARLRHVTAVGAPLALRLATMAYDLRLLDDDDFPDSLGDREVDLWEPLYAVARQAGGAWPARVRAASLALTHSVDDHESEGIQLLADIRTLFDDQVWHFVYLTDLIGHQEESGLAATGLCSLEEASWATHKAGRPITPHRVAKLIRAYGVEPQRLRIGTRTGNGYDRKSLEPVWDLYLTPAGASPVPADAT